MTRLATIGLGVLLTAEACAGGHGRRGFPPNASGYGPYCFFRHTMSAELYTTPLAPELRSVKSPAAPKSTDTAVSAATPTVAPPTSSPLRIPPPTIAPPVPMPDPKLPIPFEGEKPMAAPK